VHKTGLDSAVVAQKNNKKTMQAEYRPNYNYRDLQHRVMATFVRYAFFFSF